MLKKKKERKKESKKTITSHKIQQHALARSSQAMCTILPLEVEKEPIGKGASGQVFRAIVRLPELPNGSMFVALKKVIDKKFNDNQERQKAQSEMAHEVDLMIALPPHPNVIQLLGVVMGEEMGVITEFAARGSLDAFMYKQKHRFPPLVQRRLALDIAKGVAFLHQHNIVHRDLASRNILLDERESDGALFAKISDFGMSRVLGEDQFNHTYQELGPIKWMATEQLRPKVKGKQTFSRETDSFSFAMTLVELVTGGLCLQFLHFLQFEV